MIFTNLFLGKNQFNSLVNIIDIQIKKIDQEHQKKCSWSKRNSISTKKKQIIILKKKNIIQKIFKVISKTKLIFT